MQNQHSVELERRKQLCRELNAVIEKSTATYHETMGALAHLTAAYQDKGQHLLNGISIQEVAKEEQTQSVILP